MRAILLFSTLAIVLAAPAASQTCKKAPPPFLPSLFPKKVGGATLEFSSVPGGGCMGMYRPADLSKRESSPWAVLSIEVEPSETLGASADDLRQHYVTNATDFIEVDGWPVSVTVRSIGDEFVAIRGSLRITVMVRNGDHGEASEAIATPFFHLMLGKVPCG